MTTDNTTNQRPVATQAEWGEIVATAARIIAITPPGHDMPDEYGAASMAIFRTPAPDMGAVLERLGLFITQAWPDNPSVEDAIQRSREHDGSNSLCEDEEVVFTTYEDLKRLTAQPTVSATLRALLEAHWTAYNTYAAASLTADEDDATCRQKEACERANDALKAAFDALRQYRPRNAAELLAKVERINMDDWGLSHLPQVIEDLRVLVGGV